VIQLANYIVFDTIISLTHINGIKIDTENRFYEGRFSKTISILFVAKWLTVIGVLQTDRIKLYISNAKQHNLFKFDQLQNFFSLSKTQVL